jgi:hypothetical protein
MSIKREKQEALKRLQTLRNVGVITAEKLYAIGISSPEQILHANPDHVYEALKVKHGGYLDRCVLYQIRGAQLDLPWWKCTAP